MVLDYTSDFLPSISDRAFISNRAEPKKTGFQGSRINNKLLVAASTRRTGDNTMRERVARLEVSAEYIQKDIGDIKNTLNSFNARIKRIEIKMWIGTGMLAASAAILGWMGYTISKYLPQILHAVQILSSTGN
ncbi:TPA: hypothetical protein G8Z53_001793 [Salmonella enterica]|nr:hypothetical protein [Salmonella enterica]HAG2771096.1 hypothetical protein [Salmonella enterica]